MLALPDRATNKGKRDRALLCLLIGCGLRREELALLSVEHIQQSDARWVLVDLVGKGKRIRTVPMPAWTKIAIDEWLSAAGITEGRLLRAVNKGDRIVGAGMTAQSVFEVVEQYGAGSVLRSPPTICDALSPNSPTRATPRSSRSRFRSAMRQFRRQKGISELSRTSPMPPAITWGCACEDTFPLQVRARSGHHVESHLCCRIGRRYSMLT